MKIRNVGLLMILISGLCLVTSGWAAETIKIGFNIELTGDKLIARSMRDWLGLSPFAKERPRIAS